MQTFTPEWPVRSGIRSFVTMAGDRARSEYGEGNLALHVGDSEKHVVSNRKELAQQMGWVTEPVWLNQVHGRRVIELDATGVVNSGVSEDMKADAVYTCSPDVPCIVLTADCLPILIASQSTQEVAAVHAGWRGLVDGVVESALSMFKAPADELIMWLGPAIGPNHFEVGGEVRHAFLEKSQAFISAFESRSNLDAAVEKDKWWMNLYCVARMIADQCGVNRCFGAGYCTFANPRFYSYRKDKVTGRFATGIWLSGGAAEQR